MSLIEEALRRLGEQDAPTRVRQDTPVRRQVEEPKRESAPLPVAQTPAALPSPTSVPPVSVGPWLGFWATVGGSAALLVVGLLLGTLWNARPVSTTRAVEAAKPVPAPVPTPQSVVAVVTPVASMAPIAPLKPMMAKSTGMPNLELNGVVEGVGEPLVIINGRIVRLGETIEGATLLGVGDGAARFQWRDKELVVKTTR